MSLIGPDMSANAFEAVYGVAGRGPRDFDLVGLQGRFAYDGRIVREGLGLHPEDDPRKLIANGNNPFGGRHAVNPSGDLISGGRPPGATDAERVEGTQGLQHDPGLGRVCAATVHEDR